MSLIALAAGLLVPSAIVSDGWHINYQVAQEISRKENKPMLIEFTGSDWCGPCIQLKGNVLGKTKFKEWADQNVVRVKLDFPRTAATVQANWVSRQNNELAEAFEIQGFPTLILTDSNGNVLNESIGAPFRDVPAMVKWVKTSVEDTNYQLSSSPKLNDGYPPYITEKTLYAKKDIRGEKFPKMELGEWISNGNPELKGKTILLDFWATWCPPCRKAIPKLNKWSEEFKDDLVIIGISDEKPEVITEFLAKTEMKFPVSTDQKSVLKNYIGVQGIPHAVVITPDNVVRWQGFPESAEDILTTEKLHQIIKTYKASQANKS